MTLCLCLCHPCWAEVTWRTRSHRHITASPTSPELLPLRGAAWSPCCSVGHRRALWHGTRWHGRDTPCAPHSLGRKHVPCSIFPPRLEPAVQSLLWIVVSTFQGQPNKSTCGRAFLPSQLPGKAAGLVFGVITGHSSSTYQYLILEFFFCLIFSSSFKKQF